MANRVVRDGILDSERVNTLSWAGEVFYRRLMSIVDDFGRGDGRVPILRSKLYPLKLERVSEADIVKWMHECVEAGLVSKYTVDNKPYFELYDFNQQVRIKQSKYPANPKNGEHMIANDIKSSPEKKGNGNESIITIGAEKYYGVKPSQICLEIHAQRFEMLMMTKLKGYDKNMILKEFDTAYPFYDFTDLNHFFNSLVKTAVKPKQYVKQEQPVKAASRSYGKKA